MPFFTTTDVFRSARVVFQNQLIQFQRSRLLITVAVVALAALSLFTVIFLARRTPSFKINKPKVNKTKISIESLSKKGMFVSEPKILPEQSQQIDKIDFQKDQKISSGSLNLQKAHVDRDEMKNWLDAARQLDPNSDERKRILDKACELIEKDDEFYAVCIHDSHEVLNYCRLLGNRLTTLNLFTYNALNENEIATICNLCPNLKRFKYNQKMTDEGLLHLSQLSSLQALTLSDCASLTYKGYAYLGCLKSLQDLSLWNCKKLDGNSTQHFGKLCALRFFTLEAHDITNPCIKDFSSLGSLESLTLIAKRISGYGLCKLSTLHHLHTLDIRGCYLKRDSNFLDGIGDLRALKTLKLESKNLEERDFQYLRAMSLEKLELTDTLYLSDQGIHNLAHSLQELRNVSFEHISDQGLFDLRSLHDLRSLNLGSITDKGFAHLLRMTSLQTLRLTSPNPYEITPDGFQSFFEGCDQLKALESLDLFQCCLNDKSVRHLKKNALASLKSLSLSYCQNLTATGLQLLCAAAPSLESLSINGCNKITSKGCASLQRVGLKIDYH